jgi:hypothetical protein
MFEQEMKLVEYGDSNLKVLPLKSYQFNFQLSTDRFCPGFYQDDGSYAPCPTSAKLTQKKYEHCFYCEKKDGWKAAFIFGETPTTKKMKEYLAKTHSIYLAYFPGDKIKVGTSSRGSTRLIEQDALVYMFIAEAIGSEVQTLERAISKAIPGVQEFVQSRYKFKHIAHKPDLARASKILQQTHQKIRDTFKTSEYKSWFLESTTVEDHTSESELYFPEAQPTILKYPDSLVGEFKGLRGRYVNFENSGHTYAVDERDLVGRKIEDYTDSFEYEKPKGQEQISRDQLQLV